jgi:DNA-binding PadR family transcriptional regulator
MAKKSLRSPLDRETLVLSHFASGINHGYAIMEQIESVSGLTMGPGTLYVILDQLEREGLIQGVTGGPSRRREYQITTQGRRVLTERLRETIRVSQWGLGQLGLA